MELVHTFLILMMDFVEMLVLMKLNKNMACVFPKHVLLDMKLTSMGNVFPSVAKMQYLNGKIVSVRRIIS